MSKHANDRDPYRNFARAGVIPAGRSVTSPPLSKVEDRASPPGSALDLPGRTCRPGLIDTDVHLALLIEQANEIEVY